MVSFGSNTPSDSLADAIHIQYEGAAASGSPLSPAGAETSSAPAGASASPASAAADASALNAATAESTTIGSPTAEASGLDQATATGVAVPYGSAEGQLWTEGLPPGAVLAPGAVPQGGGGGYLAKTHPNAEILIEEEPTPPQPAHTPLVRITPVPGTNGPQEPNSRATLHIAERPQSRQPGGQETTLTLAPRTQPQQPPGPTPSSDPRVLVTPGEDGPKHRRDAAAAGDPTLTVRPDHQQTQPQAQVQGQPTVRVTPEPDPLTAKWDRLVNDEKNHIKLLRELTKLRTGVDLTTQQGLATAKAKMRSFQATSVKDANDLTPTNNCILVKSTVNIKIPDSSPRGYKLDPREVLTLAKYINYEIEFDNPPGGKVQVPKLVNSGVQITPQELNDPEKCKQKHQEASRRIEMHSNVVRAAIFPGDPLYGKMQQHVDALAQEKFLNFRDEGVAKGDNRSARATTSSVQLFADHKDLTKKNIRLHFKQGDIQYRTHFVGQQLVFGERLSTKDQTDLAKDNSYVQVGHIGDKEQERGFIVDPNKAYQSLHKAEFPKDPNQRATELADLSATEFNEILPHLDDAQREAQTTYLEREAVLAKRNLESMHNGFFKTYLGDRLGGLFSFQVRQTAFLKDNIGNLADNKSKETAMGKALAPKSREAEVNDTKIAQQEATVADLKRRLGTEKPFLEQRPKHIEDLQRTVDTLEGQRRNANPDSVKTAKDELRIAKEEADKLKADIKKMEKDLKTAEKALKKAQEKKPKLDAEVQEGIQEREQFVSGYTEAQQNYVQRFRAFNEEVERLKKINQQLNALRANARTRQGGAVYIPRTDAEKKLEKSYNESTVNLATYEQAREKINDGAVSRGNENLLERIKQKKEMSSPGTLGTAVDNARKMLVKAQYLATNRLDQLEAEKQQLVDAYYKATDDQQKAALQKEIDAFDRNQRQIIPSVEAFTKEFESAQKTLDDEIASDRAAQGDRPIVNDYTNSRTASLQDLRSTISNAQKNLRQRINLQASNFSPQDEITAHQKTLGSLHNRTQTLQDQLTQVNAQIQRVIQTQANTQAQPNGQANVAQNQRLLDRFRTETEALTSELDKAKADTKALTDRFPQMQPLPPDQPQPMQQAQGQQGQGQGQGQVLQQESTQRQQNQGGVQGGQRGQALARAEEETKTAAAAGGAGGAARTQGGQVQQGQSQGAGPVGTQQQQTTPPRPPPSGQPRASELAAMPAANPLQMGSPGNFPPGYENNSVQNQQELARQQQLQQQQQQQALAQQQLQQQRQQDVRQQQLQEQQQTLARRQASQQPSTPARQAAAAAATHTQPTNTKPLRVADTYIDKEVDRIVKDPKNIPSPNGYKNTKDERQDWNGQVNSWLLQQRNEIRDRLHPNGEWLKMDPEVFRAEQAAIGKKLKERMNPQIEGMWRKKS